MASPCKDTPENVSNENLEDLDMPETSDRLDELGDDEFAPLDFSVDFTEGPGTADIIKAIATRWSQDIVRKAGQKLDRVIKVQNIKERMKDEPFLRAMDKFSFLLGVLSMLVTEFILLRYPQSLYLAYTIMFIPMMVWRFFSYHRSKFHYFMLDFCYFCNLLLLLWLYVYPNNLKLFKLTYALSTGPLLLAVILWSNALVFHDIDRVTSLFIHIYPPLVLYAERWYNPAIIASGPEANAISVWEAVWLPIIFYIVWQIAYLVKTEIMDRKTFIADSEMITSVIWLSKIKPHAIYKLLLSKGINLNPTFMLIVFQLLYTLLILLPTMVFYQYQVANELILIVVLAFATYNGANYYFEIFSEHYRSRLLSKTNPEDENKKKKKVITFGFLPSSTRSVFKFGAWIVPFLGSVFLLIHFLC